MALTLRHATPSQLGAVFRERFRHARVFEAGRLAKWLITRIQDGDFTAAQVRAFFGMGASQFTAFRTRVETLAAKYDDLKLAAGE